MADDQCDLLCLDLPKAEALRQRRLDASLARSMADEFNFRVIDAKKSITAIQTELRRQIGEFLAENETPAPGRMDLGEPEPPNFTHT